MAVDPTPLHLDTFSAAPGLFRGPNPADLPPGALRQAVNVVVRRPGIIERRRPLRQYVANSALGDARIAAIFPIGVTLGIVDSTTKLWTCNNLPLGPAGDAFGDTFADRGTKAGLTSYLNKAPFAQWAGTTYVARSDVGGAAAFAVWRLGQTVFVQAGVQRAKDILCTSAVAASGWLAANAIVGYRVVFSRFVDSITTVGAPSGRFVLTNGASVANVTVKAWLSSLFDTNYYYQVYRTPQVTTGDPGDEGRLIYQAYLTSTDISNGFVTFTDIYPETTNKGAFLYTNASQQGIAKANLQPPGCLHVAEFKGTMFYGDIFGKKTLDATLLGIPDQWAIQSITANTPIAGQSTYTFPASTVDTSITAADKLAVTGTTAGANDGTWQVVSTTATTVVVTNAGVAQAGVAGTAMVGSVVVDAQRFFAAYAAESAVNRLFNVPTTGSVSQQISNTARSFCRVVQQNASQNAYAFYVSGADDAPGQIVFEHNFFTTSSTVQATGNAFAGKWAPVLITALPAATDVARGRVYYSKNLQPEHVTAGGYFDVGERSRRIYGLASTRDSLFVLKQDGLFRITGQGDIWTVQRLDDDIRLFGNMAYTACLNRIYALCTRGVVEITDAGSRIISGPVDNLLRGWLEPGSDSSGATAYFAASERDALVYVTVGFFGFGTLNSGISLCYNIRSGAWTSMSVSGTGGGSNVGESLMGGYGVECGNRLFRLTTVISNSGQGNVYVECDVNTNLDPATIKPLSGAVLPGDRVLYTITAVNAGARQITVAATTANSSTFHAAPVVGDLVIENDTTGPNLHGSATYSVSAVSGTGPWVLTLANFLDNGAGSFPFNFQLARCYLFAADQCAATIEYHPYAAGNDRWNKRWYDVGILFDENNMATSGTIGLYTELQTTESDQTGPATAVSCARINVPPDYQRAQRLSVLYKDSSIGAHLFIRGVSYTYSIDMNPRGAP